MTDKIVILITAGNRREADAIARALVEQELAACVNTIDPIQSVYRWEGKVTTDKELLLVVKTSRELFPEVRHAIENLHSYHVPEVICLPIIDGSRNYLHWLSESLKAPAARTVSMPDRRAKGKKKATRKPKRK